MSRARVRFHSFYMRHEVVVGRRVVAMYVSESAAIEHAWRLNYPACEVSA